MARIRTIKPTFFRSRSLAKVDPLARLTFAGLWCEADDAGRGVADPLVLKGAIWPLDRDVTDDVVLQHLHALADTNHIALYEVDDDLYFQVIKWEEHQASAYRTGKTKLPAPDDGTPLQQETTTDREKPRPVVRNPLGEDGRGDERRGDPSAQLSLSQALDSYRPAKRAEDTWSALEHELGPAQTSTERNVRGKTTKELNALKASPDEIHRRCANYRLTYPGMALTDSALLKHWSQLSEAQVTPARMNTGTAAIINTARRLGIA